MATTFPVSYTHLDVYKRQGNTRHKAQYIPEKGAVPVSYTHLDVYKRQYPYLEKEKDYY